MKERPILFSGPMVRAIREGRKTQTRRVIKPQPSYQGYDGPPKLNSFGEFSYPAQRGFKCPYGQPGDRLWVRETWRRFDSNSECACYDDCRCSRFNGNPIYKADQTDVFDGVKWRSPISMPRWASRITLEIVGVRVERLQDISASDCKAEGIQIPRCGCEVCATQSIICTADAGEYVMAYRELWESINGLGSWDLNPWVWVVEFKEAKP